MCATRHVRSVNPAAGQSGRPARRRRRGPCRFLSAPTEPARPGQEAAGASVCRARRALSSSSGGRGRGGAPGTAGRGTGCATAGRSKAAAAAEPPSGHGRVRGGQPPLTAPRAGPGTMSAGGPGRRRRPARPSSTLAGRGQQRRSGAAARRPRRGAAGSHLTGPAAAARNYRPAGPVSDVTVPTRSGRPGQHGFRERLHTATHTAVTARSRAIVTARPHTCMIEDAASRVGALSVARGSDEAARGGTGGVGRNGAGRRDGRLRPAGRADRRASHSLDGRNIIDQPETEWRARRRRRRSVCVCVMIARSSGSERWRPAAAADDGDRLAY